VPRGPFGRTVCEAAENGGHSRQLHRFTGRPLCCRTTPYILCLRKRLGEIRSAVLLAVLG
jgi:hypothetical protein